MRDLHQPNKVQTQRLFSQSPGGVGPCEVGVHLGMQACS